MTLGDYNLAASGTGSGRRRLERRLAAILGADIMGYSALMERNEEETHRRVGAELDRFRREVEKSHGRVFSFAGDGLMAEFPSAVEALKCALRVQAEVAKHNAKLPTNERILFRIGLNSGELLQQKGRIGGTAVNIAARLEQIAEPGGVSLSSSVFEQARRIVAASYEFLGDQHLKNIRNPVAVYGIRAAACNTWLGMPALPRQTASAIPDAGPVQTAVEYRPSLAVLPFRTLQKDQSDAYFAEGMVDDIIRALGGLKDLLVIARSSTQMFARAPLDLRRIGHELDVRYVLHDSVRRSEKALRIAVELTEAQSGEVIWGRPLRWRSCRAVRSARPDRDPRGDCNRTSLARARAGPRFTQTSGQHDRLRPYLAGARPFSSDGSGVDYASARIAGTGRSARSRLCAGLFAYGLPVYEMDRPGMVGRRDGGQKEGSRRSPACNRSGS